MDGNEKLYDFAARSDEAGLACEDESLTVQSDAEDADINTIVRRFGVTGQLPTNLRVPQFTDYDGVFDFQTAQNQLIEAENNFMELPAEIRARFANNPQLFLEFCSDENNIEEMRKMGLAVDKPVADSIAIVDNTPNPESPPA